MAPVHSVRTQRLAETIAWCGIHALDADPYESDEIKRRRRLAAQASEQSAALYRKYGSEFSKAGEYKKVESLFKEADISSIVSPLKDQLRTIGLKPSIDLASLVSHSRRFEIVEEVATKRADLLKATGKAVVFREPNTADGRILIYAPDDNLADGAAEYSSKGFFDANNVPPWDTWVCYHGGKLIAFVPRALEGLVKAGIDVNVETCIEWATPEFLTVLFG